MSMVINTNIQATRTHNVYNKNNDYMNQALTRVATGQKINSAKDGAANWAISEKMRERIRANDQANQNVQNDTALLKTAEGGISNTIDILKTLKERAINAANDSNMNVDRSVIAEEVRQLVKQINDNADQVKFNGRTLLKGDAASDTAATLSDDPDVAATSGASATTTTNPKPTHAVYSLAFETTALKYWDGSAGSGNEVANANTSRAMNSLLKVGASSDDKAFATGDKIVFSWKENGAEKTAEFTDLTKGIKDIAVSNGVKIAYNTTASSSSSLTDASGGTVKGVDSSSGTATETSTFNLAADTFYFVGKAGVNVTDLAVKVVGSDGSTVNADATALFGTAEASGDLAGSVKLTNVQNPDPASTSSDSQLTFHIGGEKAFSIQMTLNNMQSTGSLLNLGTADAFANQFLDAGDAKDAIQTIDNALSAALKEQTRIGAYETRLGYASDNLTTMNENLEAADSVMRDSDIAKEMTQYMKYSVLAQASQYMLAQAGQNAFSVLNLLQA